MQLGVTAALMSYVLRALSMLSLLSRSGPVPVLHAAVCATFRHGCNSSSTAVQLCSKTSYLGPVFMITGWYYISVLITCVCCAADSQLRTILASDNNLSGPLPASLGQLQYLRELHLDNNELTGTMPPASPGILWLSLPVLVT